jgi:DNA topoisomerase-1
VVRLLETSFIRVGNEEYARENDSFGLTTMKDRHARITGGKLLLQFRGKSGQEHRIEVANRRLANIVKRCRDLPGYELFQYVGKNGRARAIDSADVNRYIREIAGEEFTAKDFRTWAGTVLAVRELCSAGAEQDEREGKKAVVAAVTTVAGHLGNRPATCRKYYVHPAVLDSYLDGTLFVTMERGKEQESAYAGMGLSSEEYCVMVTIAAHQEKLARSSRSKAA